MYDLKKVKKGGTNKSDKGNYPEVDETSRILWSKG